MKERKKERKKKRNGSNGVRLRLDGRENVCDGK